MAEKLEKTRVDGKGIYGHIGQGEFIDGYPYFRSGADPESPVVDAGGTEIYENDFEIAIAEACQKFHIEDLVKEGQRRWKRVMAYIGKRIFGDCSILRDKKTVWLKGNQIPTNNNRFDYDIINILCDYYMELSDQYDKLVSAEAFSLFLGMSRDTITDWGHDESSTTRFRIYKKLKDTRLECLKDDSYDNGNVTGTMYVGNVEYGTNLPGVREETKKTPALTQEEIAARYGIAVSGEPIGMPEVPEV